MRAMADERREEDAEQLGAWARAASWIRPRVLADVSTPHNPRLAVVEANGKRRLDGRSVNYSHGTLHEMLRETFESLDLRRRTIRTALLLGFGGGSAVELLRAEHGLDPLFTAVDVDAQVFELARRWFGFTDDARVAFVVADAAFHVRSERVQHDFVLVDAFVDDRVPPALHTRTFLRTVGERVAPGGLLVFNTLVDAPDTRRDADDVLAAARAELAGVRTLDVGQNRVVVWEPPRA